jgi:hypothetical protein
MVRPHALTGGRAAPTRRTLDLATLLIADPDKPLTGLDSYSHRLMRHCLPGVLSLAEVSAHLSLPAAVTKVIVASLVDSGHLLSRNPIPAAEQHDHHLLERILDALHKL